MFSKIVVGTDGSGTATAAVKHAAELAASSGAELVVVSAYAHPKEGAPIFTSQDAPGAEAGRGLLQDVEKHYGGTVKVRTVLREGSPADAIVDVAEEENADLVVVGNKGMSGSKRALLGSVPNTVSHHAPCHVLIVHTTGPHDTQVAAYRKVLIATDGSPTAAKAVRIGADVAKSSGAQAVLVTVTDDAGAGDGVLNAAAREVGTDAETVRVAGDPADGILATAEKAGADLIVVGNKGMTGAKRFLLGSVPNKISHHSGCNVLIVKTT